MHEPITLPRAPILGGHILRQYLKKYSGTWWRMNETILDITWRGNAWRILTSGLWHCEICWTYTIFENRCRPILRVEQQDGCSRFVSNVGTFLPNAQCIISQKSVIIVSTTARTVNLRFQPPDLCKMHSKRYYEYDGWAGYDASLEDRILFDKSLGKRLLGNPMKWQDNIKWDTNKLKRWDLV
jgi:hypothetical protein